MMNNNKPKPIEIAYEEFQTKLVDLLNTCGLPAFVVAQSLQMALVEVGRIADENRRRAVDEYEKEGENTDG